MFSASVQDVFSVVDVLFFFKEMRQVSANKGC